MTPRLQFVDRDLVFQAEAEGVFCGPWDVPCRMNCESGEFARGCDVAPIVDRKDRSNDGTKYALDVGECLPLEGREHRDGGVVGGYIENDPRPCGGAPRFVATGRGECFGSRPIGLVHLGAPGDGRNAGVVVEKRVEHLVHRGEETDDVSWSVWRGRHVG